MSACLYFFRSEIHENMRCSRCQNNDGPQDTDVLSTMINSKCGDDETADIGGFAEIAGCLGNLKTSEKQVAFVFCWIKVVLLF